MKKGFTLVELLAVIVILSIIAVITVPMIKGVIDKVKLGSLEDSVYGLKSAAELYYSSNEKVETTEFICNDNVCLSDTGKKLDYKGKVEGKIKLFSDGKVSICLTSDNYASSILANEKKATTKMGGCDEETYEISEVISINKYNEIKNRLDLIENGLDLLKNSLYNKTIISSKENTFEIMANEIDNLDLNQGEAANKKQIVDSLKYSGLGITEDMSWNEISEILLNQYPEVPIGTTYNFSYKGSVEEWIVPTTGIYKLEVWGAQGGNSNGGKGGYSSGYIKLNKNQKIYICIGGNGGVVSNTSGGGGYNGGGTAYSVRTYHKTGGGGGATHIATSNGQLYDLRVSKESVIIVAGGGGGGLINTDNGDWTSSGGSGGGLTGGQSSIYQVGSPGTQTSGNQFGLGGSPSGDTGAGGGSGYYGAVAGAGGGGRAAAGGSGYIGGVPAIPGTNYAPSTSNGIQSGNGKAVITYVAS